MWPPQKGRGFYTPPSEAAEWEEMTYSAAID
jgi:hypothetical protein